MAHRVPQQAAIGAGLCYALLLILPMLPAGAVAERYDAIEVKPFGLMDVDGWVRIGYLFDSRETDNSSVQSKSSRSSWEEEFFIRTQSFIYHPGLLNMELGGGPVFVQQQFEPADEDPSSRDTLFNVQTRLNVLEIKNYPFSLYYTKSHPSIVRGAAARFIVPTERYGVSGRISSLFANSTNFVFDTYRYIAVGSGSGYSVDDDIRQVVFRTQTSFRERDKLHLRYDRWDQDTASGSPGRPINRSSELRKISELTLENYFGDAEQIKVRQQLYRQRRDLVNAQTSTLDDVRYRGTMQWKHNERFRSSWNLGRVDSQRTATSAVSQDAQYSLGWKSGDNTNFSLGIEYADQDETGFERRENALSGAANHTRETRFGPVSLGASLRQARVDQVSAADDIAVFDEEVLLSGTTPVDLANDFVVAGTVQVRNITNTQIYEEGLDYRLFVTGNTTSIQRLIGGEIADGETVLVDYRYATSGTAEFDTTNAGVSGNITLLDNVNVYAQYARSDTDLRSGELTNRVNDRSRLELGLRTRSRPLDGWTFSGHYRYITQQEDLAPFTGNYIDVALAKSFWGRLNVSVSAGRGRADYDNSDEDVDQTTYALAVGGSPFTRSHVSYDGSYIEDVGGTLLRKTLRHRLTFRWSFRLVQVSLLGQFSDNKQGASTNVEERVTLQIRRIF